MFLGNMPDRCDRNIDSGSMSKARLNLTLQNRLESIYLTLRSLVSRPPFASKQNLENSLQETNEQFC